MVCMWLTAALAEAAAEAEAADPLLPAAAAAAAFAVAVAVAEAAAAAPVAPAAEAEAAALAVLHQTDESAPHKTMVSGQLWPAATLATDDLGKVIMASLTGILVGTAAFILSLQYRDAQQMKTPPQLVL